MPTSVLLALLVAAGLLALAPALVRRYDTTERMAVERARLRARTLPRHRRSRTVPGRYPVHAPRLHPMAIASVTRPVSVPPASRTPVRTPAQRRHRGRAAPIVGGMDHRRVRRRRARVLTVLTLASCGSVGAAAMTTTPLLWYFGGGAGMLLVTYVVVLRNRVLNARRLARRRIEQQAMAHRRHLRHSQRELARQAVVERAVVQQAVETTAVAASNPPRVETVSRRSVRPAAWQPPSGEDVAWEFGYRRVANL